MSQQYRCTSLVKIYLFILEIGCRQAIFQQSEPSCDFENGNGIKVTKSNQFFSMSQQYRCTNLVKIHPFIQEIGCRRAISNQLSHHVTLKMWSRSLKSNQFLYLSQQSRCAGVVKIHLFLQEIGCRKAIFQPLTI